MTGDLNKTMGAEKEPNSDLERLIDNLFDFPTVEVYKPVAVKVLIVPSRISPYYQEQVVVGVKLRGMALIQAARSNPDSLYYSLDENTRSILDSRYPTKGSKPMTFKQIAQANDITIGKAHGIVNSLRAKLTGEVKLE